MTNQQAKQTVMPDVPDGIDDPDQIAGGQERWEQCPLRDCKRDAALLYEDFYLRDIRTNRLMCSACAVRVEMGYMAREVVKQADDRFFQGTQQDNFITLGVMAGAGLVAGILGQLVGFFFILPFFVGGAVGGGAATFARRLSEGRVTRQTQYFGLAGVVIGALLAGPLYFLFRFGTLLLIPQIIFSFDVIISSIGVIVAAWGVLNRRI